MAEMLAERIREYLKNRPKKVPSFLEEDVMPRLEEATYIAEKINNNVENLIEKTEKVSNKQKD